MTVLDKLDGWGADIKGAMARFINNSSLYISCLEEFSKDNCVEMLGSALDRRCADEAFEYAHTLKGVSGNLGLDPLYKVACKIVEPLRNGSCDGLDETYNDIKRLFDEYLAIVSA